MDVDIHEPGRDVGTGPQRTAANVTAASAVVRVFIEDDFDDPTVRDGQPARDHPVVEDE